MMLKSVTIELPLAIFERLEHNARQQRRSIPDVIRDMVLQDVSNLPPLPSDVEAELAAFANLSDDVLGLLARSTLTETQQSELAHLNHLAQQRPLTREESARQQELGNAYDRVLVRRAQAAALLKSRGYDLSHLSLPKAS